VQGARQRACHARGGRRGEGCRHVGRAQLGATRLALLLERHGELATEASGNPQGILYARLSPAHTPLSRLVLAGYQYSLRTLHALLPSDGEAWSDAPVVQLAYDAQEAARQAKLLTLDLPAALVRSISAEEATRLAGIPLAAGGSFPGGWHPPALPRARGARASVRTGARGFAGRRRRMASRRGGRTLAEARGGAGGGAGRRRRAHP
jgi:hypothetical protein